MLEGRETVLQIPHEVGGDDDERDQEREPRCRRAQKAARVLIDQRRGRGTKEEVDHRILGHQAEAERDAEHDGPAPVRFVDELYIGQQRKCPEEQ